MTSLGCNAKTCTHNDENCCCLDSIKVDGYNACECSSTCCSSYAPEDKVAKNSYQMPKSSLSIACAAHNCIYNENEKCHADHVDISGITASTSDDTVCSTFKSRQSPAFMLLNGEKFLRGLISKN